MPRCMVRMYIDIYIYTHIYGHTSTGDLRYSGVEAVTHQSLTFSIKGVYISIV
jgi:hypothetical protein